MNTVHVSVAQKKPFNPILGETFQANINGSSYYVEQTSHKPPVFNFLYLGQNYKVHGYNESEVSAGANSLKGKYKGKYVIEFKNGNKHIVFFPAFKVTGFLFGNRSLKYEGNIIIVDEANDLISYLVMNPNERGFFQKIFTKKKTNYPDYFKGIITMISKNTKYDKKEKSYTVNDLNKNVISNIEGEYSNHIKFDNEYYWQKEKLDYPKFRRMRFTLPSDSTFREDIIWLKKNNEEMAEKAKIKLEEIQRGDVKIREINKKNKN